MLDSETIVIAENAFRRVGVNAPMIDDYHVRLAIDNTSTDESLYVGLTLEQAEAVAAALLEPPQEAPRPLAVGDVAWEPASRRYQRVVIAIDPVEGYAVTRDSDDGTLAAYTIDEALAQRNRRDSRVS